MLPVALSEATAKVQTTGAQQLGSGLRNALISERGMSSGATKCPPLPASPLPYPSAAEPKICRKQLGVGARPCIRGCLREPSSRTKHSDCFRQVRELNPQDLAVTALALARTWPRMCWSQSYCFASLLICMQHILPMSGISDLKTSGDSPLSGVARP